jgi:hypothetical protein
MRGKSTQRATPPIAGLLGVSISEFRNQYNIKEITYANIQHNIKTSISRLVLERHRQETVKSIALRLGPGVHRKLVSPLGYIPPDVLQMPEGGTDFHAPSRTLRGMSKQSRLGMSQRRSAQIKRLLSQSRAAAQIWRHEKLADPFRQRPSIITSLKVGETVYPLACPILGLYEKEQDGSSTFRVAELDPLFVGRGSDSREAFYDWRDQVHRAFQINHPKCPFERTEEEEAQWSVLQRIIDVAAYAAEAPVSLREIGRVTRVRPVTITWYNGRLEIVRLDQMPREFATFAEGQWFEAEVIRDQQTWQLQRVVRIEPIDPITPLTEGQLKEFWESLTPLPVVSDE